MSQVSAFFSQQFLTRNKIVQVQSSQYSPYQTLCIIFLFP